MKQAPQRTVVAYTRRKPKSKAKRPKKPKLPPISKLGHKLEALQKQLTIKFYGTNCFTCPATKLEGKNLQLGHVPWPRSILSPTTKYDYRLTRAQCLVCNIHRGGMGAVAYERMVREKVPLADLWQLNLETKGKMHNRAWYESKIAEYTELLNEVDNQSIHPTKTMVQTN